MNTRSLTTRFRISLAALGTLLALFAALPGFAQADEIDSVVLLGTNSVQIGRSSVVTGNVVANDASPGPVLDEGAEMAVDTGATIDGNVSGDTVDLDRNSAVTGDVSYNELSKHNSVVILGTEITPLTLPVFDELPPFPTSIVGAGDDVFVAADQTLFLPEGPYGDIQVASGGTLVLGGIYTVASVSQGVGSSVLFSGPTDLRVEGRFDAAQLDSFVGPAGLVVVPELPDLPDAFRPDPPYDTENCPGAGNLIQVAGANGGAGDPGSSPFAMSLGKNSVLCATVYAPNGTFDLGRESTLVGAVLARDVKTDRESTLILDSFFRNLAPEAFAKDIQMEGLTTKTIILEGSDPEGGALNFSIVVFPGIGIGTLGPLMQLPPTSASVTYTADNPVLEEEDSFVFQVEDASGLTDTATVRINPPGDPNIPPDDPTEVVVANDQLCESINPIDCVLETIEDTAITLILTGAAPCDPTGAPDPAVPCDGIGNDVPLTFSLPSLTTSAGGTLSNLNQGTGELQEPPGADEVPQRTASVLYTPPTPFTGVDSFTFDVEGDVNDDGDTLDPGETDTGNVEISVQTFTPVPPVEARDQRVSTPMDTPVDINLSGAVGSCDPTDPDCRTLSAPQHKAKKQAPLKRGGSVTKTIDDTGSSSWRSRLTITPANGSAMAQSRKPKAGIAAALPGEELYAIDSDLDQLFEVSTVDATSTLVGSTAAGPSTPASLAFDGVDMYTIDLGGGGLYTLDLNTGAPTLVCSTGISGWQAVASDPTDEGQFYGITQDDNLYLVDRTTCTTTQVNATAGTVGGLIAALEFDANGTLWGAEFGSPGSTTENAALVTIDKTTGSVTVVSQCATSPCSGSDNFADGFQGIDFSTDGTLYGQNTNDDALYIIDTTDGSLTFIGSNATIFVKGLAFSQEVLLEAGFTILTLPAVGTLSYIDPLTGASTPIASLDLPLLLQTELVTYTPPTGVTGDPLTSFMFEQSDGLTTDTGVIELVVTGEIIIIDPCAEVGRPPGCQPL